MYTKRRKRLGRPRSKGCETCRSAKVKCDETSPICSRCTRLHLECLWSTSQYPTGGKRRILPCPLSPCGAASADAFDQYMPSRNSTPRESESAASQAVIAFPNVSDIQSLEPSNYDRMEESSSFNNAWVSAYAEPISLILPSFLPADTEKLPTLSDGNSLLNSWLIISGSEYQAIDHYKTVFALNRLFKTPRWSTYSCIIESLSNMPMVMHLLLAVSTLDMAERIPESSENVKLSQIHLQRGWGLLMAAVTLDTLDTPQDHFGILTAWLFLYQYMSIQRSLDPQIINQISHSVLTYIQRYRLDVLVVENHEDKPPDDQQPHSPLDSALTARMMLFLMFADAFAGFEGCGGFWASYINTNHNLHRSIFSSQRCVLERFWGASYPNSEVFQDIEVSSALQMGYEVASLIQCVNDLSTTVSENGIPRNIILEKKMKALETEYSTVVRLARSSEVSRSFAKENADATLSVFNFMQIYYFRLITGTSNEQIPFHVSNAMSEIMNAAYNTFTSDRPRGCSLYDLPLFAVGIETKDEIHRNWIFNTVSNPRYRCALQHIITSQRQRGTRISIAEIRGFLHATEITVS